MYASRNRRSGHIILKILLPIIFILLAAAFVGLLLYLKKDPEEKELIREIPRIEVLTVRKQALRLTVDSQGTVHPRTETVLTAEVSGVIETVTSQFLEGSFFKKGDILLEIEKVEYEAALANARGLLAAARLAYAQEQNLSEQAALDWKEMGRGEATDLVLRKPQLEKAEADMKTAEAAVAVAERNLAKTSVRAPYDGRVHSKFVDIGQTVSGRMTQLARIYSVDVAEVRLPISAKQAGYVELPESYRNGESHIPAPRVRLSSEIGGKTWQWEGEVDRVEGVVDTATRQRFVIARVEDPYGQSGNPKRPPLKIGQFVTAEITGKDLGEGFVIPRAALRPGDVVYVIDDFDRLQITPVEVAQAGISEVSLTAGLEDGDRICITQLGIVVDGMDVEVEQVMNEENGT